MLTDTPSFPVLPSFEHHVIIRNYFVIRNHFYFVSKSTIDGACGGVIVVNGASAIIENCFIKNCERIGEILWLFKSKTKMLVGYNVMMCFFSVKNADWELRSSFFFSLLHQLCLLMMRLSQDSTRLLFLVASPILAVFDSFLL